MSRPPKKANLIESSTVSSSIASLREETTNSCRCEVALNTSGKSAPSPEAAANDGGKAVEKQRDARLSYREFGLTIRACLSRDLSSPFLSLSPYVTSPFSLSLPCLQRGALPISPPPDSGISGKFRDSAIEQGAREASGATRARMHFTLRRRALIVPAFGGIRKDAEHREMVSLGNRTKELMECQGGDISLKFF